MRPTVIFDFDGTVALGDGPLNAYAAAVAREAGDEAFRDRAAHALADFAAGTTSSRDGYHAVAEAASQHGIDADCLDRAYLASRTLLATPDAPIYAPADLPQFLADLAKHADLVLVTNAPDVRLAEALASLGIAPYLERTVSSARKPRGIEVEVAEALKRGPVLSVGDIYEFDLEPAARLGADTALVGPMAATAPSAVTMAALHLPELYPAIQSWAQDARLG